MTLFDYYLQYMTEVWEGKRPAPEGITLPDSGDENARIQALGQQLQAMGMAAFVRACAAQNDTALPEELFTEGAPVPDAPPAPRRTPRPLSLTRTPTSTPLRCFWIASPWTTDWCSTSSTSSSAWIARNSSS